MRLNTGQIVNNRYRVARLLGQGGMGAVYRAWDLTLNIPVALKEMIPDSSASLQELAQFREQFQQEALVLAGLVHPNLPRVTDFFEWGGRDYLVMDFVEGENLATLIDRQGALPEAQVLRWAMQLLDALEACHQRRILHRDIKPQNIIICADGRAVLVDFGLVKLWDPHNPQTQRIIAGMGTREYASPEHFGMRGWHTEPRSDIYSLGATLYHALTGREPPSAMARFTDGDTLAPPRTLGLRLQSKTETALLQAMALDPNRRFPHVQAMRMAFGGAVPQVEPGPRWQDGETGAAARPARSSQWRWELATALAMAIMGMLAVQLLLFSRSTDMAQVIGLTIGALLLGALGWFVGDTIFQALTLSKTEVPAAVAPPSGGARPTQRLVISTRKLMRKLTPAQQIGLLVGLVVMAAGAAWVLGPIVAKMPFLWRYLPSYAFAAPLAWAAMGRKPWRAGAAHILVTSVGGAALRASTGGGAVFTVLLGASAVGALAMELFAWLVWRGKST
ncbi:MAG: serine/threonine-protein kinase [Anaerolineae bacterium]|jgi:serine/threonine-protein kinase|nr:serine/threonine-protein kinase [Anaerolineae bacterium]